MRACGQRHLSSPCTTTLNADTFLVKASLLLGEGVLPLAAGQGAFFFACVGFTCFIASSAIMLRGRYKEVSATSGG